jgi:hypothetical protein
VTDHKDDCEECRSAPVHADPLKLYLETRGAGGEGWRSEEAREYFASLRGGDDMEKKIDWDHVYLLGWYGRDGKSYLSSWYDDGSLESISVVVLGTEAPPMWGSPAPEGAKLVPIPADVKDKHAYAASLGGLYAFGWYLPEGKKR